MYTRSYMGPVHALGTDRSAFLLLYTLYGGLYIFVHGLHALRFLLLYHTDTI